MKRIIAVVLASLLLAWPLHGQPTPIGGTPATQAEVDAGTVNNKYVSPLTLNNWSGSGATSLTAAAGAAAAGRFWISSGADRTSEATGSGISYSGGVLTFEPSFIRTPATITITEGSPDTGTIDVTKGYSQATVDEATTLTPSAAGSSGQFVTVDVINAGAAAYTITVDTASDFTFTASASSTTTVMLRSNGSGWLLVGGVPTINDVSTVTPVNTDTMTFWDVSGGVAGKATISTILALGGGGGATLITTATTANISNSVTETAVMSVTIPGGTLSSNKAVYVVFSGQYINNTGASAGISNVRVKFGGTTMWDGGFSGNYTSSANARGFTLVFSVIGNAATNAQRLLGNVAFVSGAQAATTGYGAWDQSGGTGTWAYGGTSAIDSTSDQTLSVTMILSSASASHTFTSYPPIVLKLP